MSRKLANEWGRFFCARRLAEGDNWREEGDELKGKRKGRTRATSRPRSAERRKRHFSDIRFQAFDVTRGSASAGVENVEGLINVV